MIDERPIAVVAPCGAYDPERFARGVEIARARGLTLEPLPGNLAPHRYLAGTDDHRLGQLVEAWTDPRYSAVWLARGGYGLTRILDRIPWDRLPDRPIIGFSDATALFAGMKREGVGIAVHGPVVHSLPITDAPSIDGLVAVLNGEQPAIPGTLWRDGSAEGPVVGGNLCLLAATAGTPHQLDATDCIVVLEEIGEPAYRVDRMLQQVKSAGVLDGARAIVLGEFVSCRVREGADWTLRDILMEHLEPLGIPILGDAPIGHGAANRTFVWGAHGRLDAGGLVFSPPPPGGFS